MLKTSFGDISHQEDEAGILKSVQTLHGIIDEQIAKGVPSERIIVGGFSQGGAIALLVRFISC
jgi:predicted esterase